MGSLRSSVRAVFVSLLLVAATACGNVSTTVDPSSVAFLPSRVSVEDLSVVSSVVAGTTTTIRFRLVKDASTAPLYWTAHFLEQPAGGGTLSAVSGGPVASGGSVEITYATKGATVAFVTLYPSSSASGPTGDGSGDLRSFTIQVLPGT